MLETVKIWCVRNIPQVNSSVCPFVGKWDSYYPRLNQRITAVPVSLNP